MSAQSGFFRHIAIAILALILLLGLAVLIAWLVIKPKRLVYTIDDGSVHNFNITNDHLNSTFDFLIKAHNPNRRVSIYYDLMDVSVAYDGQTLAFNTLEPFYQRRRNVTILYAHLEARDFALWSSLSRELRLKKSSGNLPLEVRIKARVRFKIGVIKLKHQTLWINCSPVIVNFSSSKNFERAFCDLDD